NGYVPDEIHEFGRKTISLRAKELPSDLPSYGGLVGFTQSGCRFDQRLEHRLEIEGRATDDLEHVGRRGLLLQRLAQLIEQARVLDGDHGLGGEILDQLDLLVSERAHLLSVDGNDPD